MTALSSLLRRVRDDERGFTLVEALVVFPVTIILLLVVLMMFNVTYRQTKKVNDRVEAVANGRHAMQEVTRTLRSQVCPATTGASILSGSGGYSSTGDQVMFYTDLSGGTSSPEVRTITYDATAKTLVEKRFASTGGTWPTLTYGGYPASPTSTRTLLSNAERVSNGPIFTYYPFASNGTVSTTALTTPLSSADTPRVVQIKTNFVARPRSNQPAQASTFQSQIDVRTANPFLPNDPPRCL